MKNKSLVLPLFALFAVFFLATGIFARSIFRTTGSLYETAILQAPVSSQLAQSGGSLPAFVQVKAADSGSVQNSGLTFDSNTSTGNTIVVSLRKAPVQNCTVSDTMGNT